MAAQEIGSLSGGVGADWLDGGLGADTLIGGTGNDTYVIDSATDLIQNEASLSDLHDVVRATVNFTLTTGLEDLVLLGAGGLAGTGNATGNFISGGAGNDTLDGGAGVDSMYGGLGNDTYVVDSFESPGDPNSSGASNDLITDDVGGGYDRITAKTSIDMFGYDNIDKVVIDASAEAASMIGATSLGEYGTALTVLGNDFANLIRTGMGADVVSGNAGNDALYGGSGNDTLSGNTENDLLDGGIGNDSLNGGNGNDILYGGLGLDFMTRRRQQRHVLLQRPKRDWQYCRHARGSYRLHCACWHTH